MTELQGWIIIVLLAVVIFPQWRIAIWDHAIREIEWRAHERDSD